MINIKKVFPIFLKESEAYELWLEEQAEYFDPDYQEFFAYNERENTYLLLLFILYLIEPRFLTDEDFVNEVAAKYDNNVDVYFNEKYKLNNDEGDELFDFFAEMRELFNSSFEVYSFADVFKGDLYSNVFLEAEQYELSNKINSFLNFLKEDNPKVFEFSKKIITDNFLPNEIDISYNHYNIYNLYVYFIDFLIKNYPDFLEDYFIECKYIFFNENSVVYDDNPTGNEMTYSSRGIMFSDGSCWYLGSGEDHRKVLSAEKWADYGITTWHFSDGELILRICGYLTGAMIDNIDEFIEQYNVQKISLDVYNRNNKLEHSEEIPEDYIHMWVEIANGTTIEELESEEYEY
mgnify:CR=1 FL=1